jgi:hypothetical protein
MLTYAVRGYRHMYWVRCTGMPLKDPTYVGVSPATVVQRIEELLPVRDYAWVLSIRRPSISCLDKEGYSPFLIRISRIWRGPHRLPTYPTNEAVIAWLSHANMLYSHYH